MQVRKIAFEGILFPDVQSVDDHPDRIQQRQEEDNDDGSNLGTAQQGKICQCEAKGHRPDLSDQSERAEFHDRGK